MKNKYIVFFIGTVAEYIKLFPIIEKIKNKNLPFKIIASGQNEIISTDIARATDLKIDLQLSYEKDIVKNVFGLFYWFFKQTFSSKKTIIRTFNDVDFENSVMVVHGDTLSTVMGAVLGEKLGMRVAHVEAGLRSHRLFIPFPEEIDRRIVSKLASYNYCQGKEANKNLKNCKGEIIDTKFNTIIDAAKFAQIQRKNSVFLNTVSKPYCIFVIHRQENLLQSGLVRKLVSKAIEVSENKTVVFIMHKITENTLVKLNLLDSLNSEKNIITVPRLEYFEFLNLLEDCEFVITDGGSNQEELYYLGKPALILRNSTERNEGLNHNAVMYGGNIDFIDKFVSEYKNYSKERIISADSPSEIIANHLEKSLNDN